MKFLPESLRNYTTTRPRRTRAVIGLIAVVVALLLSTIIALLMNDTNK